LFIPSNIKGDVQIIDIFQIEEWLTMERAGIPSKVRGVVVCLDRVEKVKSVFRKWHGHRVAKTIRIKEAS